MPATTPDPTALLETRELLLVDLLHRTASVSRTAEQLGQSQPTVSIWLGKLRRRLADPLFVRTPAGMQPTPRADALVAPVREALDALRRVAEPETAFDPAAGARRFRICMTDASHVTLLPRLLAEVRTLGPALALEAARIDERTADALRSGEADLAVGLVPGLEAGFYQQTLFPQDWVCLVNAHHPRIGGSPSLAAYRAEAHIAIASGTGAALLAAAMARHHVVRRVGLELPGFLGLPAIVSTTDLVATLPRQIGETLAASAGLRVCRCPVPVESFTVKQHWHARYHEDAANRWLRTLCARLFTAPAGRGRPAPAPTPGSAHGTSGAAPASAASRRRRT